MFFGFVTAGTVVLATSCAQDEPTEPTVSDITLAKGGGGPGPKVDEAIPPDAPQDTTLDVQIIGSGFDDGSEVTMTLDGIPSDGVRTNSTQFVSATELRANITIDLEADTALYDVEVMTRRGKKGVGVDMFRVRLKGSSPETPLRDVDVGIADTLLNGLSNALEGDGLGLYVGSDPNHLENGECGVVAQAGSAFSFWPFYGGMNRKQLRDFERRGECGRNPDGSAVRRAVTINLADAKVHRICASGGSDFVICENDDPTNHSGEMTLGELIADSLVDPIAGADSVRNIKLAFLETTSGLSRGSFQVEYCGGLGFVDEGTWGLYALSVDNTDLSSVHVETQAGPDRNVASCGHYDTKWDPQRETPTPLVLLLHVDITYDVIDKP
ncbi:MAG: hypothetical protein AMS18_07765 [Gemmatimonas sp. SG8_17]|nr:MAG: hypothetical protein AMS18_07765 [Gemmatimonas sp. SG8_17]